MGVDVEFKLNPFAAQAGNENDLKVLTIVSGTDDYVTATNQLRNFLPPRLGSMFLQDWKVDPVTPYVWDGTATYGTKKPDDQSTFNIEIGVASAHFTQSLMTVNSYAASGNAPNYQGAIGVTKDGVEGCDANVPNMNWSEHHLLDPDQVTAQYISTVFNCMARMNIAPFRIFDVGECLLIGANITMSDRLVGYTADFRWIGSPNATNLQVGNINVAQKYGHDYLWIKYNEALSNNVTVKIPKYAFVERIYQFADMDSLNLDDPT